MTATKISTVFLVESDYYLTLRYNLMEISSRCNMQTFFCSWFECVSFQNKCILFRIQIYIQNVYCFVRTKNMKHNCSIPYHDNRMCSCVSSTVYLYTHHKYTTVKSAVFGMRHLYKCEVKVFFFISHYYGIHCCIVQSYLASQEIRYQDSYQETGGCLGRGTYKIFDTDFD